VENKYRNDSISSTQCGRESSTQTAVEAREKPKKERRKEENQRKARKSEPKRKIKKKKNTMLERNVSERYNDGLSARLDNI